MTQYSAVESQTAAMILLARDTVQMDWALMEWQMAM
jgi:hypothetical protein